jgi:hypothetical protein
MTYEEMKAKYIVGQTEWFWDTFYGIDVTARIAENHGWEVKDSWGKGCYDLGNQPHVVIFFRDEVSGYSLLEYVEGDTYLYFFETLEERIAFTDELAFYWWKHSGMPYAENYNSVAELPDGMHGPYGD